MFLGEQFTWINAMGLLVLIAGVVLFNYLKFKKLKEELAAAEPGKLGAGAGGHANGVAAGGGELELSRAGSGSGSELELHGGGGGGAGLGISPRHAGGGSGEHQVLMLGTRQAFLVEDEQLLREASAGSPGQLWRATRMRTRNSSPMALDEQHSA